ncbi:MAG TPA: peptidase M55 [Candidatus Korarchaeota archaeon]|nr:peptidase M55 [Candidatus Korarchaeota archaeon]
MRIYFSVDLEGICGVVDVEHTRRDGREHDRARKWMVQEVNAAVEGALKAGAEKIVVNDSHGTMRNLLPEELHPEAELIIGSPKPMSMLEGLSKDFDGTFFIGYHARSGAFGVLSHTYSGRVVADLKVNGRSVGEPGLNGLVSNFYGVPVALISGDQFAVGEALDLFPGVVGVITKEAIGRYVAKCPSPEKAKKMIEEGASKAVNLLRSGEIKPIQVPSPIEIQLKFLNPGMADLAQILPGSERIDPLTLRYVAKNMLEAYKAIRAMIYLGYSSIK